MAETLGVTENPDTIWKGDLFGRKQEAELLIAYIESVANRDFHSDGNRGYTIAVDSEYGEGKTFFLRRLAKHLQLNHPVAFVDAWADDLADEPLTALAATLKKALDPYFAESPLLKKQWKDVAKKTGKVVAIAAKGLARKALGLVISGAAVEAVEQVISEGFEGAKETAKDNLKNTGKETVDGAEKAFSRIGQEPLMEKRIAEFEEGQAAVHEMKKALSALVESLDKQTSHPPIIIVIDELDRCRPTYAIKLLEEIKHLFDVPGLIFILGIQGGQLGKSINGAYGATFDGDAYLRRFINRRYRLATPNLEPLLSMLIERTKIDTQRLSFPKLTRGDVSAASLIAHYMEAYSLTARDAFQVVDILQTCLGTTKQANLLIPYLMPLLLSHLLGAPSGEIKQPCKIDESWKFDLSTRNHPTTPRIIEMSILDIAEKINNFTKLSTRELNGKDYDNQERLLNLYLDARGQNVLDADPKNYPALLGKIGRFSNPQQEHKARRGSD